MEGHLAVEHCTRTCTTPGFCAALPGAAAGGAVSVPMSSSARAKMRGALSTWKRSSLRVLWYSRSLQMGYTRGVSTSSLPFCTCTPALFKALLFSVRTVSAHARQ